MPVPGGPPRFGACPAPNPFRGRGSRPAAGI